MVLETLHHGVCLVEPSHLCLVLHILGERTEPFEPKRLAQHGGGNSISASYRFPKQSNSCLFGTQDLHRRCILVSDQRSDAGFNPDLGRLALLVSFSQLKQRTEAQGKVPENFKLVLHSKSLQIPIQHASSLAFIAPHTAPCSRLQLPQHAIAGKRTLPTAGHLHTVRCTLWPDPTPMQQPHPVAMAAAVSCGYQCIPPWMSLPDAPS